MTSRDSNFRMILYNILDDLDKIPSADETLYKCVQDRLNTSYKQYQWTVKNIYNYVLTRSNLKVLKALSKVRKSKEKLNGNESN